MGVFKKSDSNLQKYINETSLKMQQFFIPIQKKQSFLYTLLGTSWDWKSVLTGLKILQIVCTFKLISKKESSRSNMNQYSKLKFISIYSSLVNPIN